MRSINLDQLRALTEVAALGSFSAAARKLNLTQPAISLQIRELESRWGLRLIERVGKSARATAPGRQLIEHARRIARECDHAESAMRGLRDGCDARRLVEALGEVDIAQAAGFGGLPMGFPRHGLQSMQEA